MFMSVHNKTFKKKKKSVFIRVLTAVPKSII